ncbi:MAG: methyltransferase domain-containing protein [bacterium]|nr:methyltransferase domain-containing protein [bacterium]
MNLDLNAKYWNERYLSDNFGWDAGSITSPLKEYFDQLSNLSSFILIPGAGNAYEAEYLIKKGFKNVYVCDFAPTPLRALKKRCPAIKEENLLLGDFFELDPHQIPGLLGGFDLIVEQTFFCAITPTLRKKYAEKMTQLLKPKGRLVGLLFDDPLNKDQPPFGGNKEEYLSYFVPLFDMKTFERAHNSIKPREGRELFVNMQKRDMGNH